MRGYRIVIDTSVLVAGLGSPSGASFRLLSLLGDARFTTAVSVPLVLEYESATKRAEVRLPVTAAQIDTVLDYICAVSERHEIFFLWRPHLRDPGDEMVLELAVAAQCNFIVTFNVKDFACAEQFGIRVVKPLEFLKMIGEVR